MMSIYELQTYLRQHKRFWLAPILFFVILLGILFFAAKGNIISPFIYTVF